MINDPASLIFVLVHLTGLDAAGGAHGDSDSISSLVAAVTNGHWHQHSLTAGPTCWCTAQALTRRQPPDNPTDSEAAIAAFEPAAGCPLMVDSESAPPGDLGATLVGRPVLRVYCANGGPTTGVTVTAGNAASSPASARAAPSRMWWPTLGRRRRCAARWTCFSTPPPTAPAGCFSRRPRRRAWRGPFGPGPPVTAKVRKFEFGRRFVTAAAPGPNRGVKRHDSHRMLCRCLSLRPFP